MFFIFSSSGGRISDITPFPPSSNTMRHPSPKPAGRDSAGISILSPLSEKHTKIPPGAVRGIYRFHFRSVKPMRRLTFDIVRDAAYAASSAPARITLSMYARSARRRSYSA